ncbi:MAG TPA: c-type cytochrome biogenesis protein CcmI [Gemmatimonadaceae bacterium]|nr:c-type cytochrome biogenesis protein CcmI [Gemmatimonadaceae bacterium]
MTALVLGTLLSVAALAFVLAPLFAEPRASPPEGDRAVLHDDFSDQSAIDALREIEFDQATGKLSPADYAALKADYTERALEEMRAPAEHEPEVGPTSAGAVPVQDAAIEALIQRYRGEHRGCPAHGPRPEAAAVYCSECGRYLAGTCETCGAPVEELGARFCSGCGHRLAA